MKKLKFYCKSDNILKYIIIFNLFFAISSNALAQQYKLINGTIYTCSGKITDSGGLNGSYSKNEKFTTVICSDNPQYSVLQLAFSSSDIKGGDDLCIFDGIGIGSPLLTCSSDHNNFPFVVQTTKSNPAGCLTLQFNSNNFIQGAGFVADISCKPVCQEITASIVASNGQQNSEMSICPGDEVVLKANAAFPNNALNYQQNISSCTFDWYLDNNYVTSSDSILLPIYQSGGHTVNLVVTDTLGCKSQNLALQKIKVSPKPDFIEGNIKKQICKEEQLDISTSVNFDNQTDLTLKETVGTFPKQDLSIDSLALPDGTGQSFSSVLFIGRFNPNEIIDEPSDLDQICINLEHSFLNDLEIVLTCPNGQKIILQDQTPSTGVVFLGEPVENDELLPEPIPGKGYEYCWKMNANNGTWTDFIVKNNPKTLPSGIYTPFQSFDNLLGCPMGGLWTITVNDLWNSDNGYVFYWSLEFDPSLYPKVDSFSNDIVAGKWLENQTLLTQSSSGMSMSGNEAGLVTQVWQVSDDNGCTFDYPVGIEVLPDMHPACKNCKLQLIPANDVLACQGDQINLNAEIDSSALVSKVDFFAISSELNRGSELTDFTIPVSSYNFKSSGNIKDVLNSVCLSAAAGNFETVSISLVSPDLKEINLISANTINSDKITNVCFTPNSMVDIASGAGNYSGNYQAADNFDVLQNCQVKGDWHLKVKKPLEDLFTLDNAKLDFNIQNSLHYKWSGLNNIDCDTCKTATGIADKSSKIILHVKDDYACQDSSVFDIKIQSSFPAPVVTEQILPNGQINFTWLPVAGATNYEVSINGQPWMAPNGNLSHLVIGLKPGVEVVFRVRVNENSKNCLNEVGEVMVSYSECGLLSSLELTHESCLNSGDGIAEINVVNGSAPFIYSLNNGIPTSMNKFINLASGTYTLIITDAKLCKDTLTFEIQNAVPIQIDKSILDVSCFAGNDGKITFDVSGGFQPYSYNWSQGASAVSSVSNLAAGIYTVTITDGKNCTSVQTVTINQPAKIDVNSSVTESPCNGQAAGKIDLQISGGSMPYTYFWTNSSTQSSLNNLAAGSYTVTVTDSKGCSVNQNILVSEPEPVTFKTKFSNPSCSGFSDGWLEINPAGGVQPYSYVWSSGPAIVTNQLGNLIAGTYIVTVTDKNGCTSIGSITLSDPPVLNANVTVVDEVCPDQNNGQAKVNLVSGNGPFVYAWSNGFNTKIPQLDNLEPGYYSVTISNVNGCNIIAPFEIKEAVPFTAVLEAPLLSCQNSSDGIITADVTSGIPPYNFNWNDSFNQSSNPATSLSAGNYAVTITDARNCQLILQTEIKAKDPILLNNFVVNPASCSYKNDGSILIECTGGSAPYTISWSNGLSNNFVQNGLIKGKYQYTIKDSLGCVLAGEAVIDSPEPIVIDASVVDVACKYESSGKIDLTANGGIIPYSFKWSNGDSNQGLENVKAGTYTVTITDSNNCVFAKDFPVSEPAEEFIIDAQQNYVSCYAKNESKAEVKMISGSGVIAQSLWSNNSTGNAITSLLPGIYTVTATDSYGCKRSVSVNVKEWQEINTKYQIDPTTCSHTADGKVQLTEINGGTGNGNISDYQIYWNGSSVSGSYLLSGLSGGSNLNLKIKDSQGCEHVQTIMFPETPEINFEIEHIDPVCHDGNEGSIQIKNIQGGNEPYEILWSNGSSSFNLTSLTGGIYEGKITDAKGCDVEILTELKNPIGITTQNTVVKRPVCEYDTNGSIDVFVAGGNQPYQFQWLNGSSGQKMDNLGTGNYFLTISDNSGCKLEQVYTLEPLNKIEATAEVLSAACFDQLTGSAVINLTSGKLPLTYSLDGKNFGPDNYLENLGAGNYTVTLEDADGCKESLDFTINSLANFEIEDIEDVTLEYGEPIELSPALTQTAPVKLKWNTINVGKNTCDTCLNISFLPLQTGNVWLKVTDDQGCSKVLSFNVKIEKEFKVFVPTAFSPNNDGVNDFLSVFGKDNIRVSDFAVFDQWGEKVFFSSDPEMNTESKGWDGLFRGKPLNSGVFIWMLKAKYPDGTEEILSGETTLLR